MVVIVILGILAATALPKFINFKDDAEKAAVEGTVGALDSARALWVAKSLVCGSPYGDQTSHLAHWVSLGNPDAARCETGNGIYTIAGHTFDAAQIRNGLMANPAADLFTDNPNQGDQIRFTTKTGRTVTITYTSGTGALTWTANPSY